MLVIGGGGLGVVCTQLAYVLLYVVLHSRLEGEGPYMRWPCVNFVCPIRRRLRVTSYFRKGRQPDVQEVGEVLFVAGSCSCHQSRTLGFCFEVLMDRDRV